MPFLLLLLLLAPSAFAQIPLRQTINFTQACTPGRHFVVMGVGDVLLHGPLQTQAAHRRDYSTLWEQAIPYIRGADTAYANFEGPSAPGIIRGGSQVADVGWRFENNVYSGFPSFNYHPESAKALVEDGFDVLSLANNHALDRGALGLERTIETMESAGAVHTGTRARNNSWTIGKIVRRNGLTTGWISCAFSTNGIPDPNQLVLSCLRDRAQILATIRRNTPRTDAIIITPHWGNEEQQQPTSEQRQFARDVIAAGAKLVIGNHPHVLQPVEKIAGPAGDALVAYSLGNFVSNQRQMIQQTTALLFVGLTKTPTGRTHINGFKLLPAAMVGRGTGSMTLDLLNRDQRASANARHFLNIFADAHTVWNGQEVVPNDGCRARGRP